MSAIPEELDLAGSYIRRAMRKGSDYVEDSFIVDCKDAKIQVKPFLITRNKVSRAIRKELRNNAKKYLESYPYHFTPNLLIIGNSFQGMRLLNCFSGLLKGK